MKFQNDILVYGDMNFRGDCKSESIEQISFVNWVRQTTEYGDLIIHIRNEGKRSYLQATKHKIEGLCSGASDIIIPTVMPFVCELKRKDHTKSKWQDGQKEFLLRAKEQGAFACVALGNDGAKEAFEAWKIKKQSFQLGL